MLLIPMLRSIKETDPDNQIILSTRPHAREIFENLDVISELFIFRNWKSFVPLLIKIWKADVAIFPDWHGTEYRLAKIAKIPIRIGPRYLHHQSTLLTHEIVLSTDESGIHMTERNMELLQPLAIPPTQDTTLAISPTTNEEKEIVHQLLIQHNKGRRKIVLIAPYSSDWIKDWPEEKYQELINRLDSQNYRVGLLGGKENIEQSRKFRNCFSLIGVTNIRETTYAIQMSQLLICGCTSVLHFASTTPTPIIALYRPGKAPIYAPRTNCTIVASSLDCWPCKEGACSDNVCMYQIGVDEVYQKAIDRLEKSDI